MGHGLMNGVLLLQKISIKPGSQCEFQNSELVTT